MTPAPDDDPFGEFIGELADGRRWALFRSDGWDDFIQRLSDLIVKLAPRRRQALMMLLFALVYEQLTPDEAKTWLDEHDVQSEGGVEEMISWLHQFRPPQPPPDLT